MYSIIAGVGVSILIEGVARMVEARSHIRPYWVHTGWIVFLSAVHVFSWFGLWALRNHSVWTPREIIVLLLIPLLLNTASYLTIPSDDLKRGGDMRAYFLTQVRWLHGLVLLVLLASAAVVRMIEGRWSLAPIDVMRITIVLILAPSLLTQRSELHAAQTVLLLLIVLAAIFWVVDPLVDRVGG